MIRCSRCKRPLKLAAVVSGALTIGPVCARKLGLAVNRGTRHVRMSVVQVGQKPLFEELP